MTAKAPKLLQLSQLNYRLLADLAIKAADDGLVEPAPNLMRRGRQVSTDLSPDLDRSADIAPIWLRLTHQPNIFGYWKLLGQLVMAAEAAEELRTRGVPAQAVYVALDYDTLSDAKLSRTVLPRMSRKGNLGLQLRYNPIERNAIASSVAAPSEDWFAEMASVFLTAVMSYSSLVDPTTRPRLWAAHDTVRNLMSSMTGANLSEVLVKFLKAAVEWITPAPLSVVSGTAMLRAEQDTLRATLNRTEEIASAHRLVVRSLGQEQRNLSPADFVWGLCRCGQRLRLVDDGSPESLRGQCVTCSGHWRWDESLLLPRVLLDDLLEGKIYAPHIALSHSGALGHLTQSHQIRSVLGWPQSFVEYLSHCKYSGRCLVSGDFGPRGAERGELATRLEVKSREGDFSALYYLLCLELDK